MIRGDRTTMTMEFVDSLFEASDARDAVAMLTKNESVVSSELVNRLLYFADPKATGGAAGHEFRASQLAHVAARMLGDSTLLFQTSCSLGMQMIVRLVSDSVPPDEQREFSDTMVSTLRKAIELAPVVMEDASIEGLSMAVQAALQLAQAHTIRDEVPAALEVLTKAAWWCRERSAPWLETWVLLQQAESATGVDPVAASDVLERLMTLVRGKIIYPQHVARPETAQLVTAILRIANELYYQTEDYVRAERVARLALVLDPNQIAASWLLAQALTRQEKIEEALALWKALIDAGHDVPNILYNYAGVLSSAGRLEESAKFLAQAIDKAPELPRYRFTRAQLLVRLGRHEEAVEELTLGLEMAHEQVKSASLTPSTPSMAKYLREMGPSDLCDFFRFMRAQVLGSMKRHEEADADYEFLIRNSDPPTAANAWHSRALVRIEKGDTESAIACWGEAIVLQPMSGDYRLRRIEAEIALGRRDAALTGLAEMVTVRLDLENAKPILDRLATESPQNPIVLKWRGAAAYELRLIADARRDLAKAAEALPEDSQLQTWLALASLALTDLEFQSQCEIPIDRTLKAVLTLGTALQLDPANAEARYSMLWLVDRLTADERFESMLYRTPPISGHPLAGLPDFAECSRLCAEAWRLNAEKNWTEAIVAWENVKAFFENHELPISALRCHLVLADTFLRLYELQLARNHLDRFEEQHYSLNARPFSRYMIAHVEAQIEAARLQGDPAPATVELEFLHVYSIGFSETIKRAGVLKAELASRLGDRKGALETIRELGLLEPDPGTAAFEGYDPRHIINVAIVLRDSGEAERAMELMLAIESKMETDWDYARLANTLGTVFMALDRFEECISWFERAIRRMPADVGGFVDLAKFNMASAFVHTKRYAEAVSILKHTDVDAKTVRDRDRFTYYTALAQAFAGLERWGEAQQAISGAVDFAERGFRKIASAEAREAWQAERDGVYRLAITYAVRNHDPAGLLDFVERSRARAMLYRLSAAKLPLPDEAVPVAELLSLLGRQKDALIGLIQGLSTVGVTFSDPGLLSVLQIQGKLPNLFHDEAAEVRQLSLKKLLNELEAVRRRIARQGARLEALTYAEAMRKVGAGSTWKQIEERLNCEGAAREHEKATNLLLVEYYHVGSFTLILGVLAGESSLRVATVEGDLEKQRAWVAQHIGADNIETEPDPEGFSSEQLDELFGPFVEPIAEWSKPGDLVCLIQHDALHFVPLHAVTIAGQKFLDRNPVFYAPSAAVLTLCLDRVPASTGTALVFGDPQDDLPYARREAVAVASQLGSDAIIGRDAMRGALLDALEDPESPPALVHLACHGYFDEEDPIQSGLRLALDPALTSVPDAYAQAILSVKDVLAMKLQVPLITLSACESGISRWQPGDEPSGLVSAWLQAGACSVVASQWRVDDLSTWLIMARFYAGLRNGHSKVEALRAAALAVRDMTAAEVVTELKRETKTDRDDGTARALAKLDLARAHMWSGDGDKAAKLLSDSVLADPGLSTSVQGVLESLLRELETRSDGGSPTSRPFEHFSFWAPFVLVGQYR